MMEHAVDCAFEAPVPPDSIPFAFPWLQDQ